MFLARIILLFFMTSLTAAYANTNASCVPLTGKMQDKNIILPGPNEPRATTIYFFKNISSQSIWIDHPIPHPSASAGWSSYLRPGNSSALLVNRKNFAISCAVIHPGKVEYLNCEKVISVCVANKVTMTQTSRKGTYWLSEDKSYDDLMAALKKRGVTLLGVSK